MEAQFKRAHITDSGTKFYHVLASLPIEVASVLKDDLIASEDYNRLKASIREHFEASKAELFEDLISKTPLVGKPSLWLSELEKKALRLGITQDLVKHKFLQAVPQNVRMILVPHQDSMTLTQLGQLADDIVRVSRPGVVNEVNAVRAAPQPERQPNVPPAPAVQQARNEIGLRPFFEGQRPRVCRAHLYYGSKAKHCRNWCHWPNKGNVTVAQSRSASPAPTHSTPSRDSSPNGARN